MAAPSYTTDLATYGNVASTTGWTEANNMDNTNGAGEVDSDLAIYGTSCYSEAQRKTGLGSLVFTGTAPTVPTNGGFFVWTKFFAPNSLATQANGGTRMLIGNTDANYYGWYLNGSDTYPYGGWKNYVVDPTKSGLADQTEGTPNGTWNTLGIGHNLVNAISKGNSMTIDEMRYGRGESRFTDGDLANGYATFAGFAAVNDNPTTGRWGLIQDVGGSYLYKGLMSLGLTATSVDMRDANVAITIDNTEYVDIDFNRIEVHNASSNIEWEAISFTSLSTVSPGRFEMEDNATVVLLGCLFNNMDTFIFLSNGDAENCTWNGCSLITAGGGLFNGSKVLLSTVAADASAFSWNVNTDPDGYLDNMVFSKGTNAHHAITFGANTPSTININGIEFIDFSATDGQNDSALYFPDTGSDVDWIVNATGCTGNVKYKKVRTGDTVTINLDQVSHTLIGLENASEVTYTTRGTAVDTGSDGSSTVGSRSFVTTNAWTVDAYKGHLLEITSGADAGRYYVSGNSATTLYLDAELTATASSLTWELYDENDDTTVFHVESVTGNQTQYTYTYSTDVIVDIIIIHQDYEQIVIEQVTLGNTSQSVPISQVPDANYLNP